jgi:TP901 family phage tail tape measure protein
MPGDVGIKTFIEFVPVIGDSSKVKADAASLGKSVESALGAKSKSNTDANTSAVAKYGQAMQEAQKQIKLLIENEVKGGMAQTQRQNIIKSGLAIQASGNQLTAEQSKLLKQTIIDSNAAAEANKKNLMSIAQWAIGWTAVYSVIRGVKNIVTETIKTTLELEQQIYRAVSASRFTPGGGVLPTEQVAKLKEIYTSELVNLLRHTSINAVDAGKALYEFNSAGLTVEESLSAMQPAINLTVGSFGDLRDISRMVASIYNIFGSQLTQFSTTQEKMTYITDVLAYAYNSQQVELSELTASLSYAAQSASTINFPFKDLVITLGFLGSNLIRGSKAGTEMRRSFSEVIRNADKLKSGLGITFDTTKPLNFVELMGKLNEKFKAGELTQANLFQIFGERGQDAIKAILTHYDAWKREIDITDQKLKGQAQSLKEMVSEATIKKVAELKNAWLAFMTSITDTSAFKKTIDYMIEGINLVGEALDRVVQGQKLAAGFKNTREELGGISSGIGTTTVGRYGRWQAEINQDIDKEVAKGTYERIVAEQVGQGTY